MDSPGLFPAADPNGADWAGALIGRLALRYGEAFLRQWPDVDPADIADDWREVLEDTRPEAIAWAWRYLPPRLPLTALMFRETCRCMPPPSSSALPAPPLEPIRPGVRAQLRRARDVLTGNPLEARIVAGPVRVKAHDALAIEDDRELALRQERTAEAVAAYARQHGIDLHPQRQDDEIEHRGRPW